MQGEKKRYRQTFTYEGKRYEVTANSPKELIEKTEKKKDKLKRGEVGISGNMTVARWAMEWLDTYKKPTIGVAQYKNYKSHINSVIAPAIGNLKLRHVSEVHLQQILNGRSGKSKSDLSKLRMTIKAIFQRAHQSRLITHNPAEYLELPAAKSGTRRSITDYEREKILELIKTHHAGLLIMTLLYTGIRPGESRALDWRHIDFEKRLLHIKQAMKSSTRDVGAPKSKAGIRDVPIPDRLHDALLQARQDPFLPVFVQTNSGGRHTETSMRRWWLSFKRQLDILMGAETYRNKIIKSVVSDDLCPYCLRHTYCTDLQDAGVPINVAKYLMGHADIATTAKIYTHTTDKVIQDAAEKINKHV
jgi:integrase